MLLLASGAQIALSIADAACATAFAIAQLLLLPNTLLLLLLHEDSSWSESRVRFVDKQ